MTARLLPPNATALERALADVLPAAVDPSPLATLHDPWRAPAAFLPALAWQCSVEGWDIASSEAQRRAMIDASFRVHRHKGTPYAIEQALAVLNVRADLVEWWQTTPTGQPGTATLTAWVNSVVAGESAVITPTLYGRLADYLGAVKRHSIHLTIRLGARLDAGLVLTAGGQAFTALRHTARAVGVTVPPLRASFQPVVGGQLFAVQRHALRPSAPTLPPLAAGLCFAAAAGAVSVIRLPLEVRL
ncbi:phage tail protein I [Chitinimonas koreensis]|uniref:phage tail protein I n=1 Tax=Chitinimonas koreensis TaxID=356302 RepID=UPI0003FC0713|nr:phage tail protein I [Chitinimonas koreensis]QNM96392.1 phage tail protein I [Chitinimonas koreensis]